MIILGKREKILAVAVGGLLLLFSFKTVIFGPLSEKLSLVRQDIERSELAIRKYMELLRHREEILKGQKQIERYLNFSGPDEEKMTAALTRIEKQARQVGLSIQDLNPQPAPAASKGYPGLYRVQLRAEGSLAKIFEFIYNLENADILFKITKLGLSAKDDEAKTIKLDAIILAVSLI
jgi:hypothetical protein